MLTNSKIKHYMVKVKLMQKKRNGLERIQVFKINDVKYFSHCELREIKN